MIPEATIAYAVDGQRVSRGVALAAWRDRDTSTMFQGADAVFNRAHEFDATGRAALTLLQKQGIVLLRVTTSKTLATMGAA